METPRVTASESAAAQSRALSPHYPASYRQILGFTLPLVAAVSTHAVRNLVDAAFVGQLGAAPLAALAVANFTYISGMLVLLGLTRSAMSFLAQSYGARHNEELGAWVGQYQWLAIVSLPILLALAQVFPLVAALAHLSPTTAADAQRFISIRVFEVPFTLTSVLYGTLHNAAGRSVFPMVVQWSAVGLDAVLNYGLVLGHFGLPRLELPGSAYATLGSQILSATIMIVATHATELRGKFHLRLLDRPDWSRLKRMLKVGFPQGMGDGLEVLAFLGFLAIVGQLGEPAIAASNFGLQATAVLFMPGVAMGIAGASYLGRYLGMGAPAVAKTTAYRMLGMTIGYMGALGVPFWFYGETITRWFIADPEVVRLAGWVFKAIAVYQVFDALGIVLRITLSGAGDTRFPTAAVFLCGALVMLPAAWALSHWMEPGILGAWTGMVAYIVVLGMVLLWRFEKGAWMHMSVIRHGGDSAARADVGALPTLDAAEFRPAALSTPAPESKAR